MGVLEDAIREHLDLKRQHGASDEELNEQEAEALGPARRDLPEGEAEAAEAGHDEAAEHAAGTAVADVEHAEPEHAAPEPAAPEPAAPEPAQAEAEVQTPPAEDEDPDFGAEAPEQKSPRDLDFE
jgi:hypothetical protein